MTTPSGIHGLVELLDSREILVFAGSGGVGKTTTAAAAGLVAATESDARVLVLTVDPARRLATAMGLEAFGNVETRVDDELMRAAGLRPRGELWTAMLDTKASWDDLIERHAPDERTRARILANPVYAEISGRFVQSHDYIAMERLHELHESGRYDLIVVDTPPSRNALDFLSAPERMADFFSSRLLRLLTTPARSRLVGTASKPFYLVADRILGSAFLEDISEFFGLFATMERGFVERARTVSEVLSDRRTSFVVVTTLEPAPAGEAARLIDELTSRRHDLGAVLLNRVLPHQLTDPAADAVARRFRDDGAVLASALEADGLDRWLTPRVLAEVGASFEHFALVARREAEQRRRFEAVCDNVIELGWMSDDITDLSGLARLGAPLRGS